MPFEVGAKAAPEFSLEDEVLNYGQVLPSSLRLTAPKQSSLSLCADHASYSLQCLNMELVLLGVPYLKSCPLIPSSFLSREPWT